MVEISLGNPAKFLAGSLARESTRGGGVPAASFAGQAGGHGPANEPGPFYGAPCLPSARSGRQTFVPCICTPAPLHYHGVEMSIANGEHCAPEPCLFIVPAQRSCRPDLRGDLDAGHAAGAGQLSGGRLDCPGHVPGGAGRRQFSGRQAIGHAPSAPALCGGRVRCGGLGPVGAALADRLSSLVPNALRMGG